MKFLKILGVVIGMVLTYGSGIIWLVESKMLGLPLPYWVIIGFTIFLVTVGISFWQLYSENKKLTSQDAEQERRIKRKQEELLDWERLSRGI